MTNELTRRQLLSAGAAASIAALPTPGIFAGAAVSAEMPRRKFYPILSLGRLGFQASFPESLELTVNHGFEGDRKSTRLNSSHRCISYAVFCLKKKNKHIHI